MKLGIAIGPRTVKPLEQATEAPLPAGLPAATSMILKALCVLQTVVEVVLPKIDMSVTLPGPNTEGLFLILLTRINVSLFRLTEAALWIPQSVEWAGPLLANRTPKPGTEFRRVRAIPGME